jgi:hypothetical protein
LDAINKKLRNVKNPMTDRVTLTETYKTGKGAGVIVAQSGKVRGPYTITVLVGDKRKGYGAPKSRKVAKLGDARAALRGKLGPLRKAKNPNEVIRLVLGEGERATVSETVNPVETDYGWPLRYEVIGSAGSKRSYRTFLDARTAMKGNVKLYGIYVDGTRQLIGSMTSGKYRDETGWVRNPAEANPLNKYYFQRGDGGLIMRTTSYGSQPVSRGHLEGAKSTAREFATKTRQPITVWREEPGGDQTRVLVVEPSGHARAVRNPNSQHRMDDADKLYEDFHGVAPTKTTKILTQVQARSDLAELGPVVELKVHLLTDKKHAFRYDPEDCENAIMLCSSPDGKQLYFVGGDQSIDLGSIGMDSDEWTRDTMVLGILTMVTYRTRKGFDKFKLTDYYHELGEESGMQPLLVYDNINGLLSVAGGQYEVRPEGIVN